MSGSLIEFGMGATALALLLAAIAAAFSLASVCLSRPALAHVARRALIGNFALVTIGCATVVWSFVQNDFSVVYVAQNSNTRLPLIYRLTALWGAHEGSLLLWMWILSLHSAIAAWIHWESHPRAMPYVLATLGGVQVGFLILILFLSSPFVERIPALDEGRELNPLLQDPGLIVHPPLLYLGYVGFVVPFAFAISALARGSVGAEWVVATRRWTLFAWLSLTSGIMLGGYWAYYELGWGGYWAWDPVENASLMPWLTGTALLHSVMAQEKRNLFRVWNVFLAISTFSLSLLGTFLVRSGVLTSVHAFAVDPTRGAYILGFLAVVMLGSFGLLVLRADTLRSDARLSGALSREAGLLFNNLFLLVATATVFIGTLYPLLVEVLADERITVAAPYFNKVVLPIFVAVMLLMALGPALPWRKSTPVHLKRMFTVPALLSAAAMLAGLVFGMRDPVALVASGAIMLVFASIASDIGQSVRARQSVSGESWLQGFTRLALWNRRRYGGFIVHAGVAIIGLGVLASGLFQETRTVALSQGDSFEIGGYQLTLQRIESVEGSNWSARQALLDVSYGAAAQRSLKPQRRHYPRGEMTTTESAIHSTLSGDLYVVLGDELGAGRASIRAYYIPLVNWIWVGWLIVIAGSLFALSQSRQARAAPAAPTFAMAAKP